MKKFLLALAVIGFFSCQKKQSSVSKTTKQDVYYRIAEVDQNGDTTWSTVKVVSEPK